MGLFQLRLPTFTLSLFVLKQASDTLLQLLPPSSSHVGVYLSPIFYSIPIPPFVLWCILSSASLLVIGPLKDRSSPPIITISSFFSTFLIYSTQVTCLIFFVSYFNPFIFLTRAAPFCFSDFLSL